MKKYISVLVVAILLTIMSSLLDGTEVKTEEELQEYYAHASEGEIRLGYPFPFLTMNRSNLTPPLPYTFGFEYEKADKIDFRLFLLNITTYFIGIWTVLLIGKVWKVNRFG